MNFTRLLNATPLPCKRSITGITQRSCLKADERVHLMLVFDAQMIAWATARPATRPEKRHPPRKVPSSPRQPCMPPPPKPATLPAAHKPEIGGPFLTITRPA